MIQDIKVVGILLIPEGNRTFSWCEGIYVKVTVSKRWFKSLKDGEMSKKTKKKRIIDSSNSSFESGYVLKLFERVGPQGEFLQRGVHGRDVTRTSDFVPLWAEIDGSVAKLQPLSQFRPALKSWCFARLDHVTCHVVSGPVFCWTGLEIQIEGWFLMQSYCRCGLPHKAVGPFQGERAKP